MKLQHYKQKIRSKTVQIFYLFIHDVFTVKNNLSKHCIFSSHFRVDTISGQTTIQN